MSEKEMVLSPEKQTGEWLIAQEQEFRETGQLSKNDEVAETTFLKAVDTHGNPFIKKAREEVVENRTLAPPHCNCVPACTNEFGTSKWVKDETTGDVKKIRSPPPPNVCLYFFAQRHATYFKDQYAECYACIDIVGTNGHQEYLPVRSERFKEWLAKQYWQHSKRIINEGNIKSVIALLRSNTVETRKLGIRIGKEDGTWYYDISDDTWTSIALTPSGIEIVPSPPMFRRFAHQKPFTIVNEDVDAKQTFEEFFKLFPPCDENTQYLLKCWLVAALVPDVPAPALFVWGSENSGKSTATRFLNQLVDPTATDLLSLSKKPEETVQQLSQRFCAAYDNISYFEQEHSDLFCQYITGGSHTKRKLFTDDENHIIQLSGRLILNGRPVPATASDLLRRGILVNLGIITEEVVRTEDDLLEKFETIAPKVRKCLLTLLQQARMIYPSVKRSTGSLPSFSRWCDAVSQVLGYEADYYFEMAGTNTKEQKYESLDNHIMGSVMTKFILNCLLEPRTLEDSRNETRKFIAKYAQPVGQPLCRDNPESKEIPMSEMYEELCHLATFEEKNQKNFPKAPNKMKKVVIEVANPILYIFGLKINFIRKKNNNCVSFTLSPLSPLKSSFKSEVVYGDSNVDMGGHKKNGGDGGDTLSPQTPLSPLVSPIKISKQDVFGLVRDNPDIDIGSLSLLLGYPFDDVANAIDSLASDGSVMQSTPNKWRIVE